MIRKKLKACLIVWIAIYPVLLSLQYFFGEQLAQLSLPVRSLILTGILVPLMVLALIPFWTWVFGRLGSLKKKQR